MEKNYNNNNDNDNDNEFIYLFHHIQIRLEDGTEDKYTLIQNYRLKVIVIDDDDDDDDDDKINSIIPF